MSNEKLSRYFKETKPDPKKEKIPSKEEWLQIVHGFMEINPQMEPNEVVSRTKQIMEGLNPNKTKEEQQKEAMAGLLRKERLKRLGYDPKDWTYYGITLQPQKGWDTGFTEEDMKRAHFNLPEGIELLITQGSIQPASEKNES